MLERIFGRKMEAPLQQKQETLKKKAEKFLRKERKKAEFTEKKFREYEQEKKELEKMPSSEKFRTDLERMAKPGKNYVRIPRSDIGWVNEGLSRDEDLRFVKTMLEIKECQDEFTTNKNKDSVELHFERVCKAHIPRNEERNFFFLPLNDEVRNSVLGELGLNPTRLMETLSKMETVEEKVFTAKMSGMEVVLRYEEQPFETIDQKNLKNQFKTISIRFYDPEERAREIA